jgi:phosphoglycerate dehydrogenase-like enzyme
LILHRCMDKGSRRFKTVDEIALINHLKSGHLGGAGLDVTSVEPLPDDNELWEMPNVFITSHSVGVAPRKQENRVRLFQQNLTRFLNGEPLINVVDRKIGY